MDSLLVKRPEVITPKYLTLVWCERSSLASADSAELLQIGLNRLAWSFFGVSLRKFTLCRYFLIQYLINPKSFVQLNYV
jgi:hypothetical protein